MRITMDKKVDFNNIFKLVFEANSLQLAIRYWEQKSDAYEINRCKERFNKIQNLILNSDNPFFAYIFAREVKGADIKTLETIIKNNANCYEKFCKFKQEQIFEK